MITKPTFAIGKTPEPMGTAVQNEAILCRGDFVSWRDIVDCYLRNKDVSSDDTRKTYRHALIRFFEWMEATGRRLDGMTRQDILDYKSSIDGLSSMTISLYIIAIRGFYEWAESEKLYPNIAKGVKAGHDKGVMKMHLSIEQCCRILDACRDSRRDYALMMVMIYTGMRTVEIESALVSDIKLIGDKHVIYVKGKGRHDKKDFVVLADDVLAALRNYLSGRDIDGPFSAYCEPLFRCEGRGSHNRRLSRRTIQHIAKTALRKSGIDAHEYSAHCLRHTTATLILQMGGTMFDVQKVLRHASVETSQIYVKSLEMESRIDNSPETLIQKAFSQRINQC